MLMLDERLLLDCLAATLEKRITIALKRTT